MIRQKWESDYELHRRAQHDVCNGSLDAVRADEEVQESRREYCELWAERYGQGVADSLAISICPWQCEIHDEMQGLSSGLRVWIGDVHPGGARCASGEGVVEHRTFILTETPKL